jgi:hypothetical protein
MPTLSEKLNSSSLTSARPVKLRGPACQFSAKTMDVFKRLNAEGTTIIQVRNSEKNAAYENGLIQVRNGWIVGACNINQPVCS